MKAIRRVKSWYNPLDKQYEYVERLELEPRGTMDLAYSASSRSQRDHEQLYSDLQLFIDELLSLLSRGYSVSIPGLGVVEPKLKCKQHKCRYREQLGTFRRDEISEVELKLHPSKDLRSRLASILQSIEIK